jgi:AcrR family transcriptional regulator
MIAQRGGKKPDASGAPEMLADDRGVTAVDGTTKARIERAALGLFASQGVDAATTREIAAAAGVAEGTLYRHFASKDEIAAEIFFAVHARLADLIEAAGSDREATLDTVAERVVAAIAAFADDDWTLFRFHLLYSHHFLPLRPDTKNPVSSTEEIVGRFQARGDIAASDARLIAAAALGPVLQTALHIAYGRLPAPLGRHAPQLARTVVSVLKSF